MKITSSFLLLLLLAICCFAQEKTQTPAQTIKVEADSGRGFSYPYYLFIPASFYESDSNNKTQTILVAPNNTGKISDELNLHEQNVKNKMLQSALVFNKLNAAVLMPVFPRPESDWKIYTHALDRDSLITDKKEYKRFDLQLVAIIDHAREKLEKEKIKTDKKVFIYGFSASGMFANRFTFLHPERVKAASIGSPGGWAIAPFETYNKKTLPYPIGVGDFKEVSGEKFDLKELQKVPMFIYLGDKDENDSMVYRDGYEESDEKLVFELFGKTPVSRWEISKKLYSDKKLNATFKLYPDVAHTNSKEMLADILAFFEKHKN
jgi:predicted esterase